MVDEVWDVLDVRFEVMDVRLVWKFLPRSPKVNLIDLCKARIMLHLTPTILNRLLL